MNENSENKNEYKILLLGDSKVGKTSFFKKLTTGMYDTEETITLEIEKKTFELKMKDGKNIIFSIFDSPGIYRLHPMSKRLLDIADGVILIYDSCSFNELEDWTSSLSGDILKDISVLFLCNKKKIESKKEITTEEGEKFAKEHGYMFDECSVKDDSKEKLMSIFYKLAREVYENSPEKRKEKEIMKKILEEEEIKR